MPGLKPRPSVKWFTGQMERVLRTKDHRLGWDHSPNSYLFRRLMEEVEELRIELGLKCKNCGYKPKKNIDSKKIIKEATDVANFAMMIADNARNRS